MIKSFIAPNVSLVFKTDAAKINFDFNSAKKEVFTVDLARLNLSGYKAVSFALRKNNFRDDIHLRVELTDLFKEKSEVYVHDISNKWKEYKINLSDFKNISNWKQMLELAFVAEEWNTKEKQGIVYIDNVRFLR